jgi:cyclopropane fatty-acyl-phospholipid synthase-like methyltransferase
LNLLIERVKRLQEEGVFLGGPPGVFEIAGRNQLMVLLSEGLYPGSKVLDIGCGCLRGGYWLIHFLDPECYFGIEPNRNMLDAGIRILLEPGLSDIKKPRFDGNADFDFAVFGESFDFLFARSIWLHASKMQIKTMLDGFVRYSNTGGVFITSYLRPSLLRRDYKGENWKGRNHESDAPGMARHSLSWIRKECGNRGLFVEEIKEKAYKPSFQAWLRIKRKIP